MTRDVYKDDTLQVLAFAADLNSLYEIRDEI